MSLQYGKCSGNTRCYGRLAKGILSKAQADWPKGRFEEWIELSRTQQSTMNQEQNSKDSKQLDLFGEVWESRMFRVGLVRRLSTQEKLGFYPVGNKGPLNVSSSSSPSSSSFSFFFVKGMCWEMLYYFLGKCILFSYLSPFSIAD